MRIACALIAFALLSGCLMSPPPGDPSRANISAIKLTTTSTTSTTSTTMRPHLPIKSPDDVLTTTSTSTVTTYPQKTTTTSQTTTTTATLPLKKREYAHFRNISFFLKDIEMSLKGPVFEITHNTTDGKRDTLDVEDIFLVDDLVISVSPTKGDTGAMLTIWPNPYVYQIPHSSSLMVLGGTLSDRPFGERRISLDTPLGQRSKIGVRSGADSLILDLMPGDIAYYEGLELKLLRSRVKQGYALIYALDDGALAEETGSPVQCIRGYVLYPKAESHLVGAGMSASEELILSSISHPYVTLNAWEKNMTLTCGQGSTLGDREISLVWYSKADKKAKVVIHGTVSPA